MQWGLNFDLQVCQSVADALAPLLRVALEPWMWGGKSVPQECVPLDDQFGERIKKKMATFLRRFHKFIFVVDELEKKHGISKNGSGNTMMPSDRAARVERLWTQCLILVVQNTNLRHRRQEAIKKIPSVQGSAAAATLQRQIAEDTVWVGRDIREADARELLDMWEGSKEYTDQVYRDMKAGMTLEMARWKTKTL